MMTYQENIILNTIWDKVSADIKKEFDSKPVYNKICLQTKRKSHGAMKLLTFTIKKCLTFTIKKDNYYLQVFLKERKHIEK